MLFETYWVLRVLASRISCFKLSCFTTRIFARGNPELSELLPFRFEFFSILSVNFFAIMETPNAKNSFNFRLITAPKLTLRLKSFPAWDEYYPQLQYPSCKFWNWTGTRVGTFSVPLWPHNPDISFWAMFRVQLSKLAASLICWIINRLTVEVHSLSISVCNLSCTSGCLVNRKVAYEREIAVVSKLEFGFWKYGIGVEIFPSWAIEFR